MNETRGSRCERIAARATTAFMARDVRYAGALPPGVRAYLSVENVRSVADDVAARLRDPEYEPPLELAEWMLDEHATFGRPLVRGSDVRWLNAMVVDRLARETYADRARGEIYDRWVIRDERERFVPLPSITRERHAGTEDDVTTHTLASTMPRSWRARVLRELADS